MKRKNIEQDDNSLLQFSLSPPSNTSPKPPRVRQKPTPSQKTQSKVPRGRSEGRRAAKSKTIPAPYAWATEHRAKVHTIQYLLENGIHTVSDKVQCKKCEQVFVLEYNIQEKFKQIGMFIITQKDVWHDRGPDEWIDPELPTCKYCGEEKGCKPLISEKKRSINWLFLLLGQLLACCTLEQLKYFCKHNKLHRTGAKDRLTYLSYFELCKQLDPNGPFNP